MTFQTPLTTPAPAGLSTSLYLEDFFPGQRFFSEPFVLTDDDLVRFADVSEDRHPVHTPGSGTAAELMGHGPFGTARYFGSVFASGILAETLIAGLDTHWYYRHPLRVGAQLHYETLVTGWRRTSDPSRGIVHRSIRMLDSDGLVVQEGTAAVLVKAANALTTEDPSWALPLGLPWAAAVVAELEDSSAFHDAMQLFDGTIGLASEAADVQLRVYKGQVIDIAKRTPRGPTFTLRGEARSWCELLTGERNDFIVRANRGEFDVSGDAYTYLQLTKALHLIIDAGRAVTFKGVQ
ncbi:MaoC family dehydratase [Arthrobacter sp. NPDC058097]|uniref:MaoC family dehydratase n=1 Tax=Arthrobacter sp. NPDC058097 TaxID=3346340 RepID=UPI0036DA0831